MGRLRTGVIGLGRMGSNHCRVYSMLRHAELVGVCDVDSEQGDGIARQFEVPFYSEVDALLEKVDAVSIVTPTPTHFDLANRCIAQGVHVLIEKPITETLEQARSLVQAAERSNLTVQVGHIERFNPAFRELKTVLESMTVLAIDLRRLSAFEGSNKDVDVVLDLMIHDTDLVLKLVDQDPVSISGYGLSALSGVVDHVVVQLGFESGPLTTMTASRVTEQKVRSIEVTALEGYLECDLLNKTVSVHRRTIGEYLDHNKLGVKYRQESIVERIHVPTLEPLFLELQHFIDCVQDGKPPLVTAEDGYKALWLVEEIRQDVHDRLRGHSMALDPLESKGARPAWMAGEAST